VGEVIAAGVVVAVLLVAGAVVLVVTRSPRAVPDSRAVRNHLAMARMLDGILNDDDVRPLLPSSRQRDIAALVAEYYGDKPKRVRP
jgi:hypothetical protein